MPDQKKHNGGCLCGAVTYVVTGKLRPVLNCHCQQCARWTGFSVMATAAKTKNLSIQGTDQLCWYKSSDWAERGFCSVCGSSLFWRRPKSDQISIMAGSITVPTDLKIAAHIFIEGKADFDVIHDDAPQLFFHELNQLEALVGGL